MPNPKPNRRGSAAQVPPATPPTTPPATTHTATTPNPQPAAATAAPAAASQNSPAPPAPPAAPAAPAAAPAPAPRRRTGGSPMPARFLRVFLWMTLGALLLLLGMNLAGISPAVVQMERVRTLLPYRWNSEQPRATRPRQTQRPVAAPQAPAPVPAPEDLTVPPYQPRPTPATPDYRPLPYCPKGQSCTPDGLVISVPKPASVVPPKPAPEGPDVRLAPQKSGGVNILSGNTFALNLNVLSSVGGAPTSGIRFNGHGWGSGWIQNGDTFTCPRVDYPTGWTPGQRVWVNGPNGPYQAWAPGCYR